MIGSPKQYVYGLSPPPSNTLKLSGNDLVFTFGQALGLVIYFRNLHLHYKGKGGCGLVTSLNVLIGGAGRDRLTVWGNDQNIPDGGAMMMF